MSAEERPTWDFRDGDGEWLRWNQMQGSPVLVAMCYMYMCAILFLFFTWEADAGETYAAAVRVSVYCVGRRLFLHLTRPTSNISKLLIANC